MDTTTEVPRTGRPRDRLLNRAILDAARELLIEEGYTDLRLEHVADRAGVAKATLYRRWPSKDDLAEALLEDLAKPIVVLPQGESTRSSLLEIVTATVRAMTETSYGPVVRALMSQNAINPKLGDPFRASVVHARRRQISSNIERGIKRGDIHPTTDVSTAPEILIGPLYYRLVFGDALDHQLAVRTVDTFLAANAPDRR